MLAAKSHLRAELLICELARLPEVLDRALGHAQQFGGLARRKEVRGLSRVAHVFSASYGHRQRDQD